MASSVSKSYRRNQPEEEWGNFDTENYPYFAFKSLTTLSSDREHYKIYGDPKRKTPYLIIAGIALLDLIAAAIVLAGRKNRKINGRI